MPTISRFYGIIIRMFFDEHAPPHFHAEYGDSTAQIAIQTLQVLAGGLPRRAQALVLEWAALHRVELQEDWDLCQKQQQPKKIAPLD
ncbi:MAG: DUF4160 domain-containing protein [Deltaproteobacteria bacterium]|nr:DUF4160 domain-containing protein [Deltaproteobacteria bacterium]